MIKQRKIKKVESFSNIFSRRCLEDINDNVTNWLNGFNKRYDEVEVVTENFHETNTHFIKSLSIKCTSYKYETIGENRK